MKNPSDRFDDVVPQDPRAYPRDPQRNPRATRVTYVVDSEPIDAEEGEGEE